MKNNSVSIKNLSKMYKIYQSPGNLLKEVIFRKNYHQNFWALKNINIQIRKGEVIGIIGRNGAGKSTLLKILAGTLDKTSGVIKINGKVSAILELGSGFHPEYTGRENIYNGGMILGMGKKEIERKIDSIIGFSELEDFIDRPFKTYSDGMKTRLAFSVATSINPEVLIIDEALAAGDSFFINKCIQKMINLCQSGATVLLVSHNTFLLQRLCNRIILLEKGKIKLDGDAVSVIQEYDYDVLREVNKKLKIDNRKTDGKKIWGCGPLSITKVQIMDSQNKEIYSFKQGEMFKIKVSYDTPKDIKNSAIHLLITRSDGVPITSYFSAEEELYHKEVNFHPLRKNGFFEIKIPTLQLGDGDYFITVGIFPKKSGNNSVIYLDPYSIHDKCYKFSVTRKGRPLQTVFDQKIFVSQHNLKK